MTNRTMAFRATPGITGGNTPVARNFAHQNMVAMNTVILQDLKIFGTDANGLGEVLQGEGLGMIPAVP